jgi:DNA polymerase III alpha subunit
MVQLLEKEADQEKQLYNRDNRSDSEKFALSKKGQYQFKDVPLDDPRVWALISRGQTLGCFQLEKQLGQDWARKARPTNIEELAALISILRPGPLESGMAESYAKRKNSEEEITYFHTALEPILNTTYGCLVYQEQILKICIDLAGFNEIQADNARKAVGKKKPEEMVKVKKMFIDGAKIKGILSDKEAEEIFGWIEKSVRYSFNKSHSVSYALISYFSAYQKYHFPTQFYTSWLTYSDWKPNPKEEIYNLVQDARMFGIKVLPPDIRKNNVDFSIIKDKEIIFGLSHIRGVGSSAISNISNLRGTLDSFSDFLKCTKQLKRNVAESLIKSGACDFYDMSRTHMLRQLHVLFGRGKNDCGGDTPETKELTLKEYTHAIKFIDDLGISGAIQKVIDDKQCVKKRIPTLEAKIEYLKYRPQDSNRQKSIWEKLYLGLNLTCSAADDIEKTEPNTKNCHQVLKAAPKTKITLYAVIDAIRKRKTSEKAKVPNQDFCYLAVSDNSGAINGVVVWPDKYEVFKEHIVEDSVVCIKGRKEVWNCREQIVVDSIELLG